MTEMMNADSRSLGAVSRPSARIRAINSLCRALRIVAFLMLDTIPRLRPVQKRDVAIILRLDAIGDFFIWMQSGSIEVSRHARDFGGKSILIANSAWSEYARSLGMWDEVIGVKPQSLMRRPLFRLSFMWRVRCLGAKLLIQPRAARVFLQEDCIARVASTACRIGSSGTGINTNPLLFRLGNRYYDRLIEVNQSRDRHEITRNEEFVLGLTGGHASRLDFSVADAVEPDQPVIVVLGAGESGRVWPIERLAAVVRHIRCSYPLLRIIVLGTGAERAAGERLRALTGGGIEDRVGTTSLGEYVAAIAAARLVICNDTSAYHIAMACGRRVLCFLGGGHYGWFAPYPAGYSSNAIVLSVEMDCFWCNWACRYPRADGGAFRCVASIPADTAIRSVSLLLGESNA